MDSNRCFNHQLDLLCTRFDRAKPGAHRDRLITRIEELLCTGRLETIRYYVRNRW